jgi:hypothetical protein
LRPVQVLALIFLALGAVDWSATSPLGSNPPASFFKQLAELTARVQTSGDEFGASVALSGEVALEATNSQISEVPFQSVVAPRSWEHSWLVRIAPARVMCMWNLRMAGPMPRSPLI